MPAGGSLEFELRYRPSDVPQSRERAVEKINGFCFILEEAASLDETDIERLSRARDAVSARHAPDTNPPYLVSLFLSRPLLTVLLAATEPAVTLKAVDLMLLQLGGALPGELTIELAIGPGDRLKTL